MSRPPLTKASAPTFLRESAAPGVTRSATSPRDSVRRNPLKGVHND
jgi:hypothetical protein